MGGANRQEKTSFLTRVDRVIDDTLWTVGTAFCDCGDEIRGLREQSERHRGLPSADKRIVALIMRIGVLMIIVLITSLVLLLTGCQTVEPCDPCPICREPSISEIEVLEIEKAELVQKYQACLERVQVKPTKKKRKNK